MRGDGVGAAETTLWEEPGYAAHSRRSGGTRTGNISTSSRASELNSLSYSRLDPRRSRRSFKINLRLRAVELGFFQPRMLFGEGFTGFSDQLLHDSQGDYVIDGHSQLSEDRRHLHEASGCALPRVSQPNIAGPRQKNVVVDQSSLKSIPLGDACTFWLSQFAES